MTILLCVWTLTKLLVRILFITLIQIFCFFMVDDWRLAVWLLFTPLIRFYLKNFVFYFNIRFLICSFHFFRTLFINTTMKIRLRTKWIKITSNDVMHKPHVIKHQSKSNCSICCYELGFWIMFFFYFFFFLSWMLVAKVVFQCTLYFPFALLFSYEWCEPTPLISVHNQRRRKSRRTLQKLRCSRMELLCRRTITVRAHRSTVGTIKSLIKKKNKNAAYLFTHQTRFCTTWSQLIFQNGQI